MSKVLYKECVCFIFPVLLVIWSCSCFPIDNSMAISTRKKTFPTSPHSDVLVNRTLSQNFRSRVRHQRHQIRDLPPSGHIDAYVISHKVESSKSFEQTSLPLLFPVPIRSRTQRSHDKFRHQSSTRQCNREHFSAKAFRAMIVLHVSVKSVQSARRKNRSSYSVYFNVVKRIKTSSLPVHDRILLQFSNISEKCDNTDLRRNLIRADVRTPQEFVLFLNATSNNEYLVVGPPELIRRKHKDNMMKMLEKICNPNFRPKPPRVYQLEDESSWKSMNPQGRKRRKRRLKLICRTSGLPFPRILWKKDNVTITSSSRVRITYSKRRSTLKIRNPIDKDAGRYECGALSVNGSYDSQTIEVQGDSKMAPKTATVAPFIDMDSRKPCEPAYNQDFCLNGGQCFMDLDPHELYCECPNGFAGKRCAEKTSSQPRTYYPNYTCKSGLSTKFYCRQS